MTAAKGLWKTLKDDCFFYLAQVFFWACVCERNLPCLHCLTNELGSLGPISKLSLYDMYEAIFGKMLLKE